MIDTPEQPKIDPDDLHKAPPNILDFVSIENQQFLTTMMNCREEMDFISNIQGLYAAAMSNQSADRSKVIIFQLLTLVHYHFLFASTCYMRCHMAEAFNSARIAIDGALVAAQIIHDRSSQLAYVERKKPFDKLIRHYKNLIQHKKPLPHPSIEFLINKHDFFSQIASHADIDTFAHRLDFLKASKEFPNEVMAFQYFQYPHDQASMSHRFLGLLVVFVVTLDVFADFIVGEQ